MTALEDVLHSEIKDMKSTNKTVIIGKIEKQALSNSR